MTKLVILAGGRGTRLLEFTKDLPKPMAIIGDLPILFHIMNYYSKFGVKEYIICAGYKKKIIENFFSKKINKKYKKILTNWNINIVNTGLNTNTGGRVKRVEKYLLKDSHFFLTYGDALSDININKLEKFFLKQNREVAISVVKKKERYGAVISKGNLISKFDEKNNFKKINGGFMVVSSKVFKYLKKDSDVFEKIVLEKLAARKQLSGFNHSGFWQCVDNFRDWEFLNKLYQSKNLKNIFIR